MIYITRPLTSRYGSQACLKLIVNGYEISVACDDSCGELQDLSRVSMAIYHGAQNITHQMMPSTPEVYGADVDDLFKAIDWARRQPPAETNL